MRTRFFNKRLREDVVDIRIPGGRGLRYLVSQGFRPNRRDDRLIAPGS
jgi:hypothetical protein